MSAETDAPLPAPHVRQHAPGRLDIVLRKQLGQLTLDLALAVGDELLVLVGPSGAGKSQTLRCVAGLSRPDDGRIVSSGTVLFDRAAGIDLPPQRRRIGYVPQDYALFPHMTVEENVAYGVRHATREARAAEVAGMLERLGIAELSHRRPAQLSGGQQQRVALARALITRPAALLLDEPFAALDPPVRRRLRRELVSLRRRLHLPTILVTHDLDEARAIGDRLALLADGRLLQVGPPDTIVERPASLEVASFLGLENLLPVERLQRCGDQFRLVVAGRAVTLPATCLEALAAADPDPESPIAPLFVYVPPDEPEIDRAGNGAAARDVGRLRWPARIEEVRSEGPLVLLRLRLSCREACGPTGRAPLPTPPAAGIGLPGDQEVGPELEVARSKRYLRQARLQIGDAVEVSVRPESLRLLGSSRRGR